MTTLQEIDLLTKAEKLNTRKNYYYNHKEEINQQDKANYGLNKEKILQERKAYYGLNKEKIQQKRKAYYGLNKEKEQQEMKAYYGLNKEKIKLQRKVHYHEKKRANMTLNESLYAFKNSIIWGAIYPCICCHRTRFRNGVTRISISKLKEYKISMKALDYKLLNAESIFFVKNAFWVCQCQLK